jgi:hypothetical protein
MIFATLNLLTTALSRIKCRLKLCGGHVVSGTHDGQVWVGWMCHECWIVKYYEPVAPIVRRGDRPPL